MRIEPRASTSSYTNNINVDTTQLKSSGSKDTLLKAA